MANKKPDAEFEATSGTSEPKTSENVTTASSADEGKANSSVSNRSKSDSSNNSSSSKTKKAAKNASSSRSSKSRGNKLGMFFRFLVVLILLVGLAIGGWYVYQSVEAELNRRDNQIGMLNQQILSLQQSSSQTRAAQQNIERTLASFIGDQQRQMESLASRIRSTESNREGDWLLAEAQYLVRLADQRLLVSRDTQSALELLAAADDILRELAYPELTIVRQALISDMTSLRSVASVDYQGMYFQISSAGQAIDQLGLQGVEVGSTSAETNNAESNSGSGFWSDRATALKSALANLVIVRKTSEEASWLVDAEGESSLRTHLDLLVMQSLSALVSGDQVIYQSALQEVAELLALNFQQSAARDALVAEFQLFANQSVLSEVPDIAGSMRAMAEGAESMRRINQGE